MIKIINIYWERCNLHLVFNSKLDKKLNIFIKNENNIISLQNNIENNELIINVSNTPEGTMLDRGKWNLLISDNLVTVDNKILKDLDEKSRIFKYRNDFYTYLVDFNVDDDMVFYINTEFMMKNKKPRKYIRICEGINFKEKCKITAKIIGYFGINLLYNFFHLFSNKSKRQILFFTENQKQLTSNLKYLYEECKNLNLKIKCLCVDKFHGKKTVLTYIKEIYYIANSEKIIIDNYTLILTVLKLSKKTKLIQLWHAGVGFKSVGYARFGKKGSPHPYHSCHRKCNYVIVDSEDLKEIYKEVFGVKDNVIKSIGIPRLQNYLHEETINKTITKLYELNPKFKTKKVILFSPTYRGTGHKEAYYDYSKIDFKQINDYCLKNNFIFVMKLHPFIKKMPIIKEEYKENIYNYSNLDINELIYVSDIMITDYSSCAFEYSMFNRPLIFYRYDKELYEYFHPVHTADAFTKEQYEVDNFNKLMEILEQNKNIKIDNRFKRIKKRENNKSCDIIKKEIL